MHARSLKIPAICLLLFVAALDGGISGAQTVTVDASPEKAIAFDPDKALGTSMDILPAKDFDAVYSEPIVKAGLSAGWGPISYRQNTELTYDAWHWNPDGKWSDESHKSGYFVGSAEPKGIPARVFWLSSAAPRHHAQRFGAKRVFANDGWRSRQLLEEQSVSDRKIHRRTGFGSSAVGGHRVWAAAGDRCNPNRLGSPYATRYAIEYWTGKEDALNKPVDGIWTQFPYGSVSGGTGESKVQRLADQPIVTRFMRILMTESSNTCDSHGSADPRNCVGYAIREISAGNFNSLGQFVDLVAHAPDQTQTITQASSVDPWHTSDGIVSSRIQTGFDLFFTSGYTNHLPAMIPIAMIYTTPEDSAAELAYIEKRGYAVSYVEMGEEPDGAFMMPEDYAALYVQWARALHKVDPRLKLGGPVFTGENDDIKMWPDAQGRTSWLGRFIDYLKAHGSNRRPVVCVVRALPARSVRRELVRFIPRTAI